MAGSVKDILNRVKDVAGEDLLPRQEWAAHAVNGTLPVGVVCPSSEQQAADVVGACRDGEVVVVAAGSRHLMGDVHAPGDNRPVLIVSTRKLKQVIHYTYEDMTITVQSGVLLSELDEITGTFGQHLPLDPPHAESATVGGVVATNSAGPRRLMHGTMGDYILGGAMVMADGELVRSGARTVKNVAGYDLHKLLVGSFGALGVVTQVTLKLKPIPEEFRVVEIRASSISDAEYIAGQLMRGETRPCMIELFDLLAARDLNRSLEPGQAILFVGYEDNSESVEWQVSQLQATFGAQANPLDQEASLDLYRRIVEWPTRDCDYAFEVVILGTKWNDVIRYCATHSVVAMARVGSGLVYGRGQGLPTPEMAAELRNLAGTGGSVRFTRLPRDAAVSRWGEMDQARTWMRAVKEQYDPHRIFPWPGFLGA